MLSIKTLITALLITGSVLALPEPAPAAAVENVARDAAAVAEPEPEPVTLDKRACSCVHVSNPGLYCGYCWSSDHISYYVNSGNVWNHVYSCNKQGACVDHGWRSTCANYQGPCRGEDT